MIELPPLSVGADHDMAICPEPVRALKLLGELGGPTGMALVDCDEAGPTPASFAAVTETRYAVPLVSPEIVH